MPVRIFEISKKWGIKSVDLLARLEELGIEAASHMSAISDEDVAVLAKDIVRRPIKPGKKKPTKKPAAKKAGEPAVPGAEAPAAAAPMPVEEKKEPAAAPEAQAPGAAPAAAPAVPAKEEAVQAPKKAAVEAPTVEAPKEAAQKAEQPGAAPAAPAAPEVKKPEELRRIVLPTPSKPKGQPVSAVDENLLKDQIVQAREIAEKESEEESRILRKIILPPHKRSVKKKRKVPMAFEKPARRIIAPLKPEKVEVQSPVTVRDFSHAAGIKTSAIMKKLMEMGLTPNINQVLPDETVELLGVELGVEVSLRKGWTPEAELSRLAEKPSEPDHLTPRAPVVTLLGHVDHGKTSLLDAIRHSDVTTREFGGITQHTGAYRVTTDGGHTVTFLDTPGHEAFTEMRARGANVTDIAILVVAADDGVMPQTVEAVNHAKAAGVPIVVAVNKIDKPDAQVERVKRQLTNYGLLPEEWGGETMFVPVSATTGEGVDHLVEMIALQAEVLELKADPTRPARGAVIEAKRTEGRGPVATVLVQEGTLKVGDIMLAGGAYGRIRNMSDERGKDVEEATPSMPVEVCGLNDVPYAGDRFYVLDDLQRAREMSIDLIGRKRAEGLVERKHVSLENLLASFQQSGAKELKLVLKADVQGTLEVLNKTLADLSVPEVAVRVIHNGVGGINESDVLLADASDAIIVGFNVVAEAAARALAENKKVEIRLYNVIYHLIDEMRAALENRLEPEIREVLRGHAEIREVFKVSRVGSIAGCRVTDGVIPRRATLRVARQGIVIHEGQIDTLRHFKDDVREVREGFECGIKIAGFDDVKVGDILEAFETEKIPRKLA